jgi:hypothetical protein
MDGKTWAPPITVLWMPSALQTIVEHTCDPSVVRFTPPGETQGYYYLFYSSLLLAYGVGTVNSVARAPTPNGPFAPYLGGDPTNAASWQMDPPSAPAVLQVPARGCGGDPQCYGAGEPSVVLRDDGELWLWYSDSTATPANVYLTKSRDGVHWGAAQPTNVPRNSVSVKYDAATKRYVMLDMLKQHGDRPQIVFRSSLDGITWQDLAPPVGTRWWASEPGMTGDMRGFMIPGAASTLIGFAAPYDFAPVDQIPHWELFVTPVAVERR